jgi:hypothetical protein
MDSWMLREAYWMGELESFTLNTMVNVPSDLGVPESTPVEDRPIPAGKPPVWLQVYGAVPPRATRVVVGYACPLVPWGSDVVTTSGGPVTFTHSLTEVSVLAL